MSGTLRILMDDNITYGPAAFDGLGEVSAVDGRAISAQTVKDVDILLVRSGTKVNEALLEGSAVKFVATATIGFDHVDLDYLASRGIPFYSAPGSNAPSVAEYVASALLLHARREGRPLGGQTVGVVGVGNVGSRVVERCRALGMNVLENDPPRERAGESPAGGKWHSLDEMAAECDIVCFHTPLTREGPDATFHLAGDHFFSTVKPRALFLNGGRGGVHDERTVKWALQSGRIRGAILDVWETEPAIDTELFSMVELGTPHIAGHSLDGKAAGTRMLLDAVCREFELTSSWAPADSLPVPEVPSMTFDCRSREAEDLMAEACLTVYDPAVDDAKLRRVAGLPDAERGDYFQDLRRNYPVRREFAGTRVELEGAPEGLAERFRALGFTVA